MRPARIAVVVALALALALGACASPVGTSRVDPTIVQRDLARSALSTGEPSWQSSPYPRSRAWCSSPPRTAGASSPAPVETGDDGVVRYTSAHLDGVESEVVVRSPHSTQGRPETIEEMRRILRLHAGVK